jgi:hypothetical protein
MLLDKSNSRTQLSHAYRVVWGIRIADRREVPNALVQRAQDSPWIRVTLSHGSLAGAPLRQLGCLTVWITDEAVAWWQTEPRTTPGGQPHYSAPAITTAPTMRAIFHLALRQAEGVIDSVVALLGFALTVAPMARTECARLFPCVLWMPR